MSLLRGCVPDPLLRFEVLKDLVVVDLNLVIVVVVVGWLVRIRRWPRVPLPH